MQKEQFSFDHLPVAIYELGKKIDQLLAISSKQPSQQAIDEIGGIDLACKLTRLSSARIYTLVQKRAIPHSKRGNRLYFRRSEIQQFIADGNRPIATDEAEDLPFGPPLRDPANRRQRKNRKGQ